MSSEKNTLKDPSVAEIRTARLEEFRNEVDGRLCTLDQGKGIDGETVFALIRKKSELRRQKQS